MYFIKVIFRDGKGGFINCDKITAVADYNGPYLEGLNSTIYTDGYAWHVKEDKLTIMRILEHFCGVRYFI